MEKNDEFVEMRVRTIDEAMKVDELIGHLTFNQVMDDEEKMDIMMLDGQNFKLRTAPDDAGDYQPRRGGLAVRGC